MAGGGPGNSSGGNVFQARLNTGLGGQSATLTLLPYKGNQILVGGRSVTVPGAGMTRLVTDHLITAAGADAGAAGIANTLYYVYVSNALATFSPSSIRLSATPPTLVNGVNYLGNAGNALNWRFVGWVQLNATPQFESSLLNRLIVNYYNRQKLALYTNPGYVNDNAITRYSTNSSTWVTPASVIGGGAISQLTFISNGEDAIDYKAVYVCFGTNPADDPAGGVGEDSVSQAACVAVGSSANQAMTVGRVVLLSQGSHTLDMLICNANPVAGANYNADDGRFAGGAADIPATMMSASVSG